MKIILAPFIIKHVQRINLQPSSARYAFYRRRLVRHLVRLAIPMLYPMSIWRTRWLCWSFINICVMPPTALFTFLLRNKPEARDDCVAFYHAFRRIQLIVRVTARRLRNSRVTIP